MQVLVTITDPQAIDADDLDVVEMPLCDTKTIGVYVEVPDATDAFAAVAAAAGKVAPLGGTVGRIVVRDPDAELDFPVMGVSEFGQARDISRYYASQLSRRGDFPLEEAVLAAGPVWDAVDVARWIRDEKKNAGRRRRRR